jgi:putative two-component system response regulator
MHGDGIPGDRRRVLVADGEPLSALVLKGILEGGFDLERATSGAEALRMAKAGRRPDIVLLDSEIRGPDAYATLELLKSGEATANLPVVFIAPLLDEAGTERALRLGAVDFILKPYTPSIVKLRIANQLELARSRAELEALIVDRTRELKSSRLELIRHLCRAAEYRDNETGLHILRMSKYAQIIARAAGANAAKAELVLEAAPMHDIGKIGIPDSVLLKPGPLDEGEWKTMRSHCRIGADIIGGGDSELSRDAATAALTHHERYDGRGYPAGLAGEAIPWIGRVVALADVFDALTSDRPYKRAWPIERALEHIRSESGSHFDPELVAAFLDSMDEVTEVMALCSD